MVSTFCHAGGITGATGQIGGDTLRNLLASYEIHVAHYYLTRQAYVAAANHGPRPAGVL